MIDASGVGDAVVSQLRPDHSNIIGARIVAGDKAVEKRPYWSVGKQFLVKTLMQAFTRKKLKVTAEDPGRTVFKNELGQFRQFGGPHPKFEAGTGHDDTVIAAALAVFGKIALCQNRTDSKTSIPQSSLSMDSVRSATTMRRFHG